MNRNTSTSHVTFAGVLLLIAPALAQDAKPKHPVGYDDTPMLPGQTWRVHDSARPNPPVVAPGEGAAAPSDAVVLFDGTDLSKWVISGKRDEAGKPVPAAWKVENGYMAE